MVHSSITLLRFSDSTVRLGFGWSGRAFRDHWLGGVRPPLPPSRLPRTRPNSLHIQLQDPSILRGTPVALNMLMYVPMHFHALLARRSGATLDLWTFLGLPVTKVYLVRLKHKSKQHWHILFYAIPQKKILCLKLV